MFFWILAWLATGFGTMLYLRRKHRRHSLLIWVSVTALGPVVPIALLLNELEL